MTETKPRQRPNRQKTKQQITVRLDSDLLAYATAKAAREGLRPTDALEQGLSLYLREEPLPGAVLRGRFLWARIPKRLRDLTLRFWAWDVATPTAPYTEWWRKPMYETLSDIPEADVTAALRKLAGEQREEGFNVAPAPPAATRRRKLRRGPFPTDLKAAGEPSFHPDAERRTEKS